jgi:cytochrome c oxidase subunit 2
MSLKKIISKKAITGLAVMFTGFLSATSVFAQEAAAAAATTAKPVDMNSIYKSTLFYILLFLLLCLFIAIVGKAIKVYELTRSAQDKPEGINWNTVNAVLFLLFLIVGMYGVYWEYTVHGKMILPDAASEHGAEVDKMFNITLILTTIVFIGTHIVLFLFSFFYKYNKNRRAYFYPHNNTLERIWTIIPALVLAVLVVMGFITWRSIFYKIVDPNNKPLDIEVTGQQFAFYFRYPGKDNVVGVKNYKMVTGQNTLGIDFKDKNTLDDQSAEELVIPVNKPVRMILTSKDVIHGFYMPHFRVQLLMNPGMVTFFEFTPTITTTDMQAKVNDPAFQFVLLCSQVCGSGHYAMKRTVRVVTQEEYNAWIAQQPTYLNNDLRKQFNLPVIAEPALPAPNEESTTPDSGAVRTDKKELALLK